MGKSLAKSSRSARGRQNPGSRKKAPSSTFVGCRNYSLYVTRVLKEVVPDRGLASPTLEIMNVLINNISQRVTACACSLMCFRKRRTLRAEDLREAVLLSLPDRLAQSAVAYGNEALQRYASS